MAQARKLWKYGTSMQGPRSASVELRAPTRSASLGAQRRSNSSTNLRRWKAKTIASQHELTLPSKRHVTLEQALSLRRSSYETILKAYCPVLQASNLIIGRDELSAYNKYHFCVRWYRLQGYLADMDCITSSIANYLPPILRSICNTNLCMCHPDMLSWTRADFGLVTTFMQKHTIGKHTIGKTNHQSYQELQLSLILTLSYWLQKLDDHNLLDYPEYKTFSRWSMDMCRSFFRQGSRGAQPSSAVSLLKAMLAHEPVKAINTLYTMQRLGICPQDATAVVLWHAFSSEWKRILQRTPTRLKEYFYGLTHFVLNESNFYQEPVHLATRIDSLQEVLNYILDWFNEHIAEVVTFGDPDLAGEVALCYLLCNRETPQDWESCGLCITLIEKCLQTDESATKYVLRNGCHGGTARGMKMEEHTNAVCMLALGFWVQRSSMKRCVALTCYRGPLFSHDQWRELCKHRRLHFGSDDTRKHAGEDWNLLAKDHNLWKIPKKTFLLK